MIYFVSDAHLGSRAMTDPAQHQSRLLSLLQTWEQDATAVFLLGDIFDFWYEYLWERYPSDLSSDAAIPRSKRPFAPILRQLRRMTDRGIEVHFFIGNHDIWTFGGLERMTGVILHRTPETLTLYGRRCFLAHGDGLVPDGYIDSLPAPVRRKIRRFMRLRAFFHNPAAQLLFRFVPPRLGDAFGYEWARRSRVRELANPFPYKGEHHEELVLFAKQLDAKNREHIPTPPSQANKEDSLYIFGHRHIELDLLLPSSSRVLILGDFFRQFTFASLAPDGTLLLSSALDD